MPTPPANQPLGHDRIVLLLVNEPLIVKLLMILSVTVKNRIIYKKQMKTS